MSRLAASFPPSRARAFAHVDPCLFPLPPGSLPAQSVRAIADELRATCSALAPPRYKVITHVVLWEKDGEASAAASRALWSAKEDAVALKVAESDTLCAAAAVWALYFE